MNMNSRNVTYSKVGDYLLPNLTLPQQEKALGKYGRLRRTYLMKHRPVLYNSMLLSGTLHPHLLEVEQSAESRIQQTIGYILAYTLNYNNHDGRYSHSNKEWADITCKGERGNNIRTDWIVRSHPAVLNGFVDMYRKELAAEQQQEPEKPFVQQFYVVTDLQTNPMQMAQQKEQGSLAQSRTTT